jgi:hypothetical protein
MVEDVHAGHVKVHELKTGQVFFHVQIFNDGGWVQKANIFCKKTLVRN